MYSIMFALRIIQHTIDAAAAAAVVACSSARWLYGSGESLRDQVALEARVAFEEFAGKRVTSFLEIVNDGTTAVFYDWKKVPKIYPFEIVQEKVQRFYFNTGSGEKSCVRVGRGRSNGRERCGR